LYYLVSILNFPLNPLTYRSKKELKEGFLVKVTLNNKEKFAVVLKEVQKPDFKCLEILSIEDKYFSKEMLLLAKFIADYYVCSFGEAINLFVPYSKKGKFEDKKIQTNITLSKRQKEAFDYIQKHDKSLLFGDTGSGKTEIYIKLIEEVVNEGKSALFLMPEISLTPQMKNRLKKVFGSLVAIWHSKVTKKSKETILEKLQNGEVRVIAGTRSSLFLPFNNLGLIIVDEEHDEAYKSNSRPRYNARDLAILFAKRKNAKVLLASATPTLSSYKNFPTFRLRGTFFNSSKKFIYEDSISELNENILKKIEEHLKQNSQVMVFLPTRANFKYLTCKCCGGSVSCPYCSVGMSLHVAKNALVCHYCNYTTKIPLKCENCGSFEIEAIRIGTAEVVKVLKERFKDRVIKKFDKDEINTNKKLNTTLKEFNEGNIDVLVGTQMLSKGHDYHNVSLSVIMGLDSILNMNDFRARQRAMSLLLQVSGRAGRSGEAEVYIQSKNCEFFKSFINDYEEFIKDELQYTKEFYPPYVKLLKVLVSHKSDKKASEILEEVLKIAEKFKNLEIIGSGRANIEKIANKYRYNVLLRSKDAKELLKFAHSSKHLLHVEIDMDPLSFS
jgi:primosomal protein N' (replication factor Y)